jgi:hypothetical protein
MNEVYSKAQGIHIIRYNLKIYRGNLFPILRFVPARGDF